MSIKSLSIQSFSIKSLIGFSTAIALLLIKGFAPLAGTDALSAAAVGAEAAVVAHAGGHGGHGGNGNGRHGGHDRPDNDRPEPAEIQAQISDLRTATARFHDIKVAIQEGYEPFRDCFANPPEGNMGYHYANPELIEDPAVDPHHPELLLYEKQTDGRLRFVGVEYIALQAAWHQAGNRLLPRLFGQRFHLNTTTLDEPFYMLHVWQWKYNPSGRFVDWNPRVVCR